MRLLQPLKKTVGQKRRKDGNGFRAPGILDHPALLPKKPRGLHIQELGVCAKTHTAELPQHPVYAGGDGRKMLHEKRTDGITECRSYHPLRRLHRVKLRANIQLVGIGQITAGHHHPVKRLLTGIHGGVLHGIHLGVQHTFARSHCLDRVMYDVAFPLLHIQPEGFALFKVLQSLHVHRDAQHMLQLGKGQLICGIGTADSAVKHISPGAGQNVQKGLAVADFLIVHSEISFHVTTPSAPDFVMLTLSPVISFLLFSSLKSSEIFSTSAHSYSSSVLSSPSP